MYHICTLKAFSERRCIGQGSFRDGNVEGRSAFEVWKELEELGSGADEDLEVEVLLFRWDRQEVANDGSTGGTCGAKEGVGGHAGCFRLVWLV